MYSLPPLQAGWIESQEALVGSPPCAAPDLNEEIEISKTVCEMTKHYLPASWHIIQDSFRRDLSSRSCPTIPLNLHLPSNISPPQTKDFPAWDPTNACYTCGSPEIPGVAGEASRKSESSIPSWPLCYKR